MNKIRDQEGRDWGRRGLRDAREMYLAQLSVTATLCYIFSLHKQRQLFLCTKPKAMTRSTRCSSTRLVLCRIYGHCSFLLSKHGTRIKCRFLVMSILGRGKGESCQPNTTSLSQFLIAACINITAISGDIVVASQTQHYPSVLLPPFCCICTHPASLNFFLLLPNICSFSKLLHFSASSPSFQSFPPP